MFTYSSGNTQLLCITDPEMVKQISLCTSLKLGKPAYMLKERKPMFGEGIISSSGHIWAYQRKIIAPELYLDKVKVYISYQLILFSSSLIGDNICILKRHVVRKDPIIVHIQLFIWIFHVNDPIIFYEKSFILSFEKGMVDLMVVSTSSMLRSWESRIDKEGGIAEIKVDEYLRNSTADLISRACFGSSYDQGKDIFLKLRTLQQVMSKALLYFGVPGFRYTYKLTRILCLCLIPEKFERKYRERIVSMLLLSPFQSENWCDICLMCQTFAHQN